MQCVCMLACVLACVCVCALTPVTRCAIPVVSDAAKSEEWVHSLVKTLVWVVSREHTGSPLLPVLEELNVIAENGLKVHLG